MTATATLVHTTSLDADNALRVARVAAAGRVQRARLAAEYRAVVERARAEAVVDTYLSDAERAGALKIGFKICLEEGGKLRYAEDLATARWTLVHYFGADMEAWGITASGEYVAIW
jgi:hypothetical protein